MHKGPVDASGEWLPDGIVEQAIYRLAVQELQEQRCLTGLHLLVKCDRAAQQEVCPRLDRVPPPPPK